LCAGAGVSSTADFVGLQINLHWPKKQRMVRQAHHREKQDLACKRGKERLKCKN